MYLTGSKTVSVDAQGRITLPAEYRDEFKEESGNKVCLILVKEALWGFTPEGHREWVMSHFKEGFNANSKKDNLRRLRLNSSTVTVEIDKSGRLPLNKVPAAVQEKLGLGKDAVVVGDADHFAVYNTEKWAEQLAALMEDDDDMFFDED